MACTLATIVQAVDYYRLMCKVNEHLWTNVSGLSGLLCAAIPLGPQFESCTVASKL